MSTPSDARRRAFRDFIPNGESQANLRWSEKMEYYIGQRVILNGNEIGTVVKPEHNNMKGIWVWPASRLWPSCYDPCNVKPLPNGQL